MGYEPKTMASLSMYSQGFESTEPPKLALCQAFFSQLLKLCTYIETAMVFHRV